MKKPELLAPAGSLEKLKMAIIYGADAVYLGGQQFGLRAAAKNFTLEEIEEGVKFAHDRGKKVFVTVNILAHNNDLKGMPNYIEKLNEIGVDAVIVSDPGVINIVKEVAPDMEIHLSTQANMTNYASAKFWYNQGVKRIVVARELSLKEIKEIIENKPKDLEIEAFVHGAMCISYSGRCLLSNYMVGRDANRGACAHPCRWRYYLVEEKRPGEYFPIEEDERGTFIFNSKDLCMIEHIPELIEAGIHSFKIEGRMKSAYYVATIVRAYRMLIDKYLDNPNDYVYNDKWLNEIKKASHRDFTTGFYFGKPTEKDQLYTSSSYIRNYDFVGLVLDYDKETNIATIQQRNRMFQGDEVEIFGPNKEHFNYVIEKMWDKDGNEIEVAPHPQQIVKMKIDGNVEPWDMLRKARKE
ncbi:peptidase U32 family protein [Caldisalinibacter kiritimatiensis]|uniref:Peptidase, U32 family large subunit n=1 Tax=Caldisalinibacter kiritimatiensis TaxID=1304284 RepID=R1ATX8_9FIRM|nr:U32 family peptidase [Caldisalinibacter kiritimatiensis]EOD00122.1 peptidase, U32 family large subunit [Caldisalinibacter kiritimatiensis]